MPRQRTRPILPPLVPHFPAIFTRVKAMPQRTAALPYFSNFSALVRRLATSALRPCKRWKIGNRLTALFLRALRAPPALDSSGRAHARRWGSVFQPLGIRAPVLLAAQHRTLHSLRRRNPVRLRFPSTSDITIRRREAAIRSPSAMVLQERLPMRFRLVHHQRLSTVLPITSYRIPMHPLAPTPLR